MILNKLEDLIVLYNCGVAYSFLLCILIITLLILGMVLVLVLVLVQPQRRGSVHHHRTLHLPILLQALFAPTSTPDLGSLSHYMNSSLCSQQPP
jgi:hypothetical protein